MTVTTVTTGTTTTRHVRHVRRVRHARRAAASGAALALAASFAVAATPAAQAAVVAADSTTTTTTTPCATGSLPSSITGRPSGFTAGLPAGYWVWKDRYGWHLRVTHAGDARKVFTGSITSSDPMRSVSSRTESGDRVLRSADRRTVSFVFTNYGGVDGLDFAPGCSQDITLKLAIGGAKADPVTIRLGGTQENPASNPFTISRTAPAA